MKRFGLGLAFLLLASSAQADDPKARAKEAYARGVAAHDAHDFKAATRAFAEADAILPSATALTAALDAAVQADDPVLGAELIERGARPGATPELTKSLADARAKLGGRAGKVRVTCPSGSTCSVLVDDRSATKELWVAAGAHVVTTRVDTTMKEQTVDVHPGETIVLSPEKPAPVAQPVPAPLPAPIATNEPGRPAEAPKRKGLSPLFVYVGAGVTLAMVGGAITTGILAKGRHDEFREKGCHRGPGPDCESLQNEGVPLMIGANAFIGVSILGAAATTVLAVAFTDWHASVSPSTSGATFTLGRNF